MKRTGLLIAALLALLLPTVAHAAFPGRNGAIVFVRWSEGIAYDEDSGDVFTHSSSLEARAPGGALRTLASCSQGVDCAPFAYGEPAISPDGQLVALRDGNALALVGIGGGDLRLLSHPSASWGAPSFAPGGRRLALESSSDELAPSLWVSDLDGGRAHRVVDEGHDPAWSTRNWIAFGDIDGGISRVRPDGRGLRSLVLRGEHPAWAPDGKQLAFTGLRRSQRDLYVTDGLGRHLRRIPLVGPVYDVAWSPDGRKLLVAGEIGGRGPGLVTVDPRTHTVHHVGLRRRNDLDTLSAVDWQPLPR
jgi:Tol biopolymer transport system component